jgi:hypothetical protein
MEMTFWCGQTVCNHHYVKSWFEILLLVNSNLGHQNKSSQIKKQHYQNRLLVFLSSLTLSLTIGQANSAEREVLLCLLAALLATRIANERRLRSHRNLLGFSAVSDSLSD